MPSALNLLRGSRLSLQPLECMTGSSCAFMHVQEGLRACYYWIGSIQHIHTPAFTRCFAAVFLL